MVPSFFIISFLNTKQQTTSKKRVQHFYPNYLNDIHKFRSQTTICNVRDSITRINFYGVFGSKERKIIPETSGSNECFLFSIFILFLCVTNECLNGHNHNITYGSSHEKNQCFSTTNQFSPLISSTIYNQYFKINHIREKKKKVVTTKLISNNPNMTRISNTWIISR